ncbi:hypothetical protein WDV93_11200 [Pantoea ananatis]
MSNEKKNNPLNHPAPTTGPESSQPGLEPLAPKEGSHQPPAEPTPPGKKPTAPGSLKAPDTHSDNSINWKRTVKTERTAR